MIGVALGEESTLFRFERVNARFEILARESAVSPYLGII